MAATPIASMSQPLGRVRRSADSHRRSLPSGSLNVMLYAVSSVVYHAFECVGIRDKCRPFRIFVVLELVKVPSSMVCR